MNDLVAKLTGKSLSEDVPVPVGTVRQPVKRSRAERARQNTAAAMMGMAESSGDDDDSIIPDDAEQIEGSGSDVEIDGDLVAKDQEPAAARVPPEASAAAHGEPLLTPRSALVAPDVTPEVDVALDTSEVPAPPQQAASRPAQSRDQGADALKVLLGRAEPSAQPQAPMSEPVVTAEAAQAAVNTVLQTGGGGDVLRKNVPMPPPEQANTSKIMEAFYRFGPPVKA